MSTKATGSISATNIASALTLCYTHTATITGPHRFQARLNNAAGNATYTVALYVQKAGAGSWFTVNTDYALASGQTTPMFPTITVDLDATDKAAIYIKGTTGDSAVTGTVDIWYDDYAKATDTIAAVTTVNGLAANVITAASMAADAGAEIADAVWDEALSGHTTAGTTGDKLNDINATSVTVTSAVSGSTINVHRGDTLSAVISGLAATTGYTTIWWTVKRNYSDADTSAVIMVKKNASGTGDGLIYLNGTAGTAALGSLTVATTAVTIALDESATDDLTPARGLLYDIQALISGSVTTIATGVLNIDADVTKAIA